MGRGGVGLRDGWRGCEAETDAQRPLRQTPSAQLSRAHQVAAHGLDHLTLTRIWRNVEMSIRVRLFLPTDSEFIIAIVTRLSEFDLPAWRRADQIDNTNVTALKNAMEQSEPDTAIFVAEDETEGQLVGFIRLQTQTDYFTGKKHGYISNVAVEKSFEGKGIGRMLLEKAEMWARDKGYDLLTLHVFVENKRAQQIYEKKGFCQDIVRYVKVIAPNS
jgi:ribosomal protein S18 acetylase RimI-like enzyme